MVTPIDDLFAAALSNGGDAPIDYGFIAPASGLLAVSPLDDSDDPLPYADVDVPVIPSPPSDAVLAFEHTRKTQESLMAITPSTITCPSAAGVTPAPPLNEPTPRRHGLATVLMSSAASALLAVLLAFSLASEPHPISRTATELHMCAYTSASMLPPAAGAPSAALALMVLLVTAASTAWLMSPALRAVLHVLPQSRPTPCTSRRHSSKRVLARLRRLRRQKGCLPSGGTHDGSKPETLPPPYVTRCAPRPPAHEPTGPTACPTFPPLQGYTHITSPERLQPRVLSYPSLRAAWRPLLHAALFSLASTASLDNHRSPPFPRSYLFAAACHALPSAAIRRPSIPSMPTPLAQRGDNLADSGQAEVSRACLSSTGDSLPACPSSSRCTALVIDSGASFHMHPRLCDLSNTRPCADKIVGIDHAVHTCSQIGDLPMLARDSQGVYHKVTLPNVRFAPTLRDTLISVDKLWRESKVTALFGDNACLKEASGRVYPVQRERGLFMWRVRCASNLRPTSTGPDSSALTAFAVHSSRSTSHIEAMRPDVAAAHIHRRLHIGVKRMALLPTLTADAPANISKARHNACPHCVTANATRLSHKESRYVESEPGRLVHADIAGPFLRSAVGGFQYLLVLVDDHTRFKFIFPLKDRKDAPACIRRFIASVNRLAARRGSPIAKFGTLHSDGAGEFTSGKFRDELSLLGADKTEAPPEVHALNGVAERAIRAIFSHVRADLEASAAPRTFWPEAAQHAVDILNRTTCPPHNRCTCYEALTNERPRVMSLLPWGCRAWAVKPSAARRKTQIDSTAVMGMHLGRNPAQPGAFLLWVPSESKIVSTSEAYFDETCMPWRPPGDQRVSDPIPERVDADAAQPPTIPLIPIDELDAAQPPLNTLSAEYERIARAARPAMPRVGSARLSRKVLLLFSGPYSRPDGLIPYLQRLGLHVLAIDNCPQTGGGSRDDILRDDLYADLLRRAQRGEFLAVFAAPPCSTFSIARFLSSTSSNDGGPPPVRYRSRGQVSGRLDCPAAHRRELREANTLVQRMCAILRAAADAGSEFAIENPADHGDPSHPAIFVHPEHAPLWLMPDVLSLGRHASCRSVSFPLCAFGARVQKWTTLLYTPGFAAGLDDFSLLRCTHRRHDDRAGGDLANGVWNSKATAAYPPDFNQAIANAINLLVDRLDCVARSGPQHIAPTRGHEAAAMPIPPREPPPHRVNPPLADLLPALAEPSVPAPTAPFSSPAPPSASPPTEPRPDLPSSRTRFALRHADASGATTTTLGGAALADALDHDDLARPFLLLGASTPPAGPNGGVSRSLGDPRSRAEAMREDAEGWSAAERRELDNHKTNGSFELIDRSQFEAEAKGRRLVKLIWVYKRKRSGALKARLCVQGCTQQAGVDYDQTFCSTLKGASLRLLSALAGQHGLGMHRWDFVSAYLQGSLEEGETVYCQPPPGPYGQLGADDRPRVWRVAKPVYGMAQAGRRWQRSLFPWLKEWGLKQCESDDCVFHLTADVDTPTGKRRDTLIIGCYVDDLFILYSSNDAHSLYARFIADLQARWDVEDEGPVADLLNIEIAREGDSVLLRQTTYIEKLASAWFPDGPPAHMHSNSTPHTDDLPQQVLDAVSATTPPDPDLLRRYRSLVGSLLYAATSTRPDVAYTVGMLCRALAQPTPQLFEMALRCLAYLYRHRRLGLCYERSPLPLEGMADADWAVRHSTSGFVFTLAHAAISWGSKRQQSIAISSCEAEIMAASEAAKEAVYLDRLVTELDFKQGADPIRLCLDNRAAIDSSYNPENHNRTKHIERRHYFIRELVSENKIVVPFVPSDANLADFFTKPLRPSRFFPLRDKIMNVKPVPPCP